MELTVDARRDLAEVEAKGGFAVAELSTDDLERLQPLVDAGYLTERRSRIEVTDAGVQLLEDTEDEADYDEADDESGSGGRKRGFLVVMGVLIAVGVVAGLAGAYALAAVVVVAVVGIMLVRRWWRRRQ